MHFPSLLHMVLNFNSPQLYGKQRLDFSMQFQKTKLALDRKYRKEDLEAT